MSNKPRKVTAKITRVVTEIAVVYLDRQGNIEELHESLVPIEEEYTELHEIRYVHSHHEN